MNQQEKNWQNFCDNHVGNWYGTWTKYSADGEIIESVQSLRSLKTNPEKTLTFQKNRYTYPDGRIEERQWQSTTEARKTKDGLIHPKHPWMRSLFFEQGAALWVTKYPQPDLIAHKTELFFKDNYLRLSVGTVYDPDGNLQMIWNFREDSRGFPSEYWSSDINFLQERNFKDNWIGKAINLNPDLNISPFYITELNWPCKNHQSFFIPDGISLSCPKKIELGSPFKIIANWFITSSNLRQLIVNYDKNLAFSEASLEFYD